MNYEQKQFEEQQETNALLVLNTVATVITGVSTIILSIMAFIK